MDQIILDFAAFNKLAGCTGPAAICDESGRVAGVFQPGARLGPEVDEAELDRRMQMESDEFTTTELLQYLESL